VVDALDGKTLGYGPEVKLMLKKGEVRVIKDAAGYAKN
jgi:hypothetical protein